DTYSVYVEATDDDGDSASCSGTVTIEEEEESTEPTISCDLFPSEGSVDEELTLTLDVTDEDSVIAMFGWDFGDGDIDSTTDTETNHAYGSEDTFTVQVTAYDSDGNEAASCSTDIEITEEIETNQAPEVDCSMMPTTGVVDQEIELEVEATDSDGEIVEYYWTFGDGEDDTTTVDLTSHIYTSADAFTIGILVTDDDGDTGFCQQDIIIADDLPAIAVASADPTEGEAILKVKFSSEGSSGNEPLSYKWSFGDGSGTSTQANPVHYYDEEGVYVAVLLVTDADGDTDTDSVTITVGDEVANNAQNHYYIDGLAVGNDGIVNAGDTLELYVSTENIADMDKDKVTINAIMQEIGVYATSGEFDLDEDDTESVVLYLDIPADTEPGTYYVRVTVSDDDVKRVIYRDIIVTA
ncbi:hypothetical protein COV16_02860, partial [Candidatus Woesearchaeota archaeon CG10_big_fil_rev_8_21_14_0_10_34_8]